MQLQGFWGSSFVCGMVEDKEAYIKAIATLFFWKYSNGSSRQEEVHSSQILNILELANHMTCALALSFFLQCGLNVRPCSNALPGF